MNIFENWKTQNSYISYMTPNTAKNEKNKKKKKKHFLEQTGPNVYYHRFDADHYAMKQSTVSIRRYIYTYIRRTKWDDNQKKLNKQHTHYTTRNTKNKEKKNILL